MAESYSVEAVLSATDKNFSKTMKGAVGSVDNMNSSILSSISGLGSKISSGLGTALKVGITTAFAGAAATAAGITRTCGGDPNMLLSTVLPLRYYPHMRG